MAHPFYQTSEEAKKTSNENIGKTFIVEDTKYVITGFETLDLSSESVRQDFDNPEKYPLALDNRKYLLVCEVEHTNTEDEDEPFQLSDKCLFYEIEKLILS